MVNEDSRERAGGVAGDGTTDKAAVENVHVERIGKKPFTTRRAFLTAALCVAGGLAIGAAAHPLSAEADELRPPGAQADPFFTALCIKCQRCVTVCPEHIILPSTVEDGLAQARMPKLDYSARGCTFCDKCYEVCPTMAVLKPDPYAPLDGRIGIAKVYPDTCIPFANTNACGVCKDNCPYGAISLDGNGRPVVDENLCNGCGMCEAKCPANVATSFTGGATRGIGVVTEKVYEEQGGAWNA